MIFTWKIHKLHSHHSLLVNEVKYEISVIQVKWFKKNQETFFSNIADFGAIMQIYTSRLFICSALH